MLNTAIQHFYSVIEIEVNIILIVINKILSRVYLNENSYRNAFYLSLIEYATFILAKYFNYIIDFILYTKIL